MKLFDSILNVPVYQYDCDVIYSEPRKPTVFENILLTLLSEEIYNCRESEKLRNVFEKILCVPDADKFIPSIIQELKLLGVIRFEKNSSEVNDSKSESILLTVNGHDLLQKGILPSKNTHVQESFYYNPVKDIIMRPDKLNRLAGESSGIFLDEKTVPSVFPTGLIINSIPKSGYPWWGLNTIINEVLPLNDMPAVFWYTVVGQFDLNENGVLQPAFPDEDLNRFLNGIDGNRLFKILLEKQLFTVSETNQEIERLELTAFSKIGSVREFFPVLQLQEKINQACGFRMIKPVEGLIRISDEIKPGTFSISFEGRSDNSSRLDINDAKNGIMVRIPEDFPLKNKMFWDGSDLVFGAVRTTVSISGEYKEIPLAFSAEKSSQTELDINSFIDLIWKHLDQRCIKNHLFRAYLMDKDQFWESLLNLVVVSNKDLDQLVSEFNETKILYQNLTGKKLKSDWDIIIEKLASQWIDRQKQIQISLLEKISAVLTKTDINESTKKSIWTALLSKAPVPASWEEFEQIAVSIKKACAQEPAFPSHLYSIELIRQYLDEFHDDRIPLKNRNRFEYLLGKLKSCDRKLRETLGIKSLADIRDKEPDWTLISRTRSMELKKWIKNWTDHYNELKWLDQSITEVIGGTLVGKISQSVENLNDFCNKQEILTSCTFEKIYIVDTCVFINNPDILRSFHKNAKIVVSKMVIEELDDKKKDARIRKKISQAIKSLKHYKHENLSFEETDLENLPIEYRIKGDNFILSLAMKYRGHGTVLLTDDENLSLKAMAEGISTMYGTQYLDEYKNTHQEVKHEHV